MAKGLSIHFKQSDEYDVLVTATLRINEHLVDKTHGMSQPYYHGMITKERNLGNMLFFSLHFFPGKVDTNAACN